MASFWGARKPTDSILAEYKDQGWGAGEMAQAVKALASEPTRTWVQTLRTHTKSQACACNPSDGKTGSRCRWLPRNSQAANLVYMVN